MKALFGFLGIIAVCVSGAGAQAGDITIASAWLRATPKGAPVAGGYATITNHGTTPDRLVGAALPIAPDGEVHSMSMTNGVMHMARLAEGLPIPPGATVTLKPGGFHLMFQKPAAPLEAGQTLQGTLSFAHAGKVGVTFAVAPMGAKSAPTAGGMGDMPGMK